MMKEAFYVVLLLAGLAIGWFVSGLFKDDVNDDNTHISFEQATKQSKFNLVRDNYAEFFNICEEGGIAGVGAWKALIVAGYRFQYGIDTADISLHRISEDGVTPEQWEVDVKKLELGSAEIDSLKSFVVDKTIMKKYEAKIRKSQESMNKRRIALGLHRLHGDPSHKIVNLLQESIKETLSNIAQALDRNIQIVKVNMPKPPKDWKKGLTFEPAYKCGKISPIFDDRLKSALPPVEGMEEIPPLEVFEFPLAAETSE